MHQVEEPGQPLATTSEGGATAAAAVDDPQQEAGNELEVGASGDESQEERQGTGSETEELAFMRQVPAVRRSHPTQKEVGDVRLSRFSASRQQRDLGIHVGPKASTSSHLP